MNTTTQEKVELLAFGECYISEQNTRILPTPKATDIQSLAQSMEQVGQTTPGIVRKTPRGFEICAGARRFVAAKLSHQSHFKAIVRQYTDDQFEEILLVENHQREDPDPVGEVKLMERYRKRGMRTVEQLSDALGKPRHWVERRLQLLRVVPEIRTMWEKARGDVGMRFGAFSVDMMSFLGSLPEETQRAFAKRHGEMHVRSLPDLKKSIDRHFACRLSTAPFDLNDKRFFGKGCGPGCACDSAKQPALFDFEKKEEGRCLNPSCYKSRVAKFQAARLQELEKTNGKLKLVSKEYQFDREFPVSNRIVTQVHGAIADKEGKDQEKVAVLEANGDVRVGFVHTGFSHSGSGSSTRNQKSKAERLTERKRILQGKRWHKIREELGKAIEAASLKQCVENVVELVLCFGLHYTTETWTFKEAVGHWNARKKKGFPIRGNKFTFGFDVTEHDKQRDAALWESFKPVLAKLILLPGNVGAAGEGEPRLRFVSALIKFPIDERKRAIDKEILPPKSWGPVNIHTLEPISSLDAVQQKLGLAKKKPAKTKPLTPAGRKRLGELMKARWAARRKKAVRS